MNIYRVCVHTQYNLQHNLKYMTVIFEALVLYFLYIKL